LESNPLAGKVLTEDFSGFRSFRIGNYRVIYQQVEQGLKIMLIEHRKKSTTFNTSELPFAKINRIAGLHIIKVKVSEEKLYFRIILALHKV